MSRMTGSKNYTPRENLMAAQNLTLRAKLKEKTARIIQLKERIKELEGPKVAGRWTQGSAIALAYVAMSKGGEFSKEELQRVSGARWIVNHLKKEATKYGDFEIVKNKNGKFVLVKK